jgi:DNA-binding NtrC family response regulator
MAEKPIANQTVLAVFPLGEDRALLTSIFAGSHWKLRFTRTLSQTQTALGRSPWGVVISESCLSEGHCWKDLLLDLQKMEHPPLIVAGRLADERLWVEVLNLGAYDLLATPFDANEVLQAARRKLATSAQRGSVAGTSMPTASGQ